MDPIIHKSGGERVPLEDREAKGLLVRDVLPDSPGWDAGLRSGDRLISLNRFVLRDLIDLEFHQSDSEILVEYRSGDGNHVVELEKDPDSSLGVVVDPPPIRRCPNDCEFCFVDQMPPGARKTLYIRDEDYRYSFLYGNFITLTNLSEKDYLRILEQRLSPLYISVHATLPDLRRKILKNEKAPDILTVLRRLIGGGITLQTQIVLTPGVNDGQVLERSWNDLIQLYPGVGSLAIVPVGLTAHRSTLPKVPPIDRSYAREMLRTISRLEKESVERVGDPFVYPADEWYVIAEKEFPSLRRYGSLPQLGNGVGIVPLFLRQWKRAIRACGTPFRPPLVLVTGTAFAPILNRLVDQRKKQFPGVGEDMQVLGVANGYFGSSVTVAGLLASRDIISGVLSADLPANSLICIPDICLKDGSDLLVDDGTLGEIGDKTGREVVAVPSSSLAFLEWAQAIPAGRQS